MFVATTVTAAGLCLPGHSVLVAFPSLAGGPTFASPLSFLLPLAAVIVFCQGVARQNDVLERQADRRIWFADVALALAGAGTFAAGLLVDPGAVAVATARNAVGYFGAALLGARLFSHGVAAVVPVVWAVVAATGGVPLVPNGLWNWPCAPADDPAAWGSALTLAVAGAMAYLARYPAFTVRLSRAPAVATEVLRASSTSEASTGS